MACNGMASSFFPPNFLLQMQTATHVEEEQQHHHHQHQHHQYHHASAAGIPEQASYGAPPAPFQTTAPAAISPHDYHALGLGGPLPSGKKSVVSLSGPFDRSSNDNGGDDDLSDDCSQAGGGVGGEKKRRLNVDQVRTLERNFELGNKLEPERKMQLARALGLQPRQIAIWFQNRRARWKTKQLEKDYDVLKKQYDAVKNENDALQARNKKLQAEIIALKGSRDADQAPPPPPEPINLNKETEGTSSNRSDNSSPDVHLDISRAPPAIDSPLNPNAASTASTSRAFFASIRQHQQQPPQQLIHTPMPCRPEVPPLCPKIEHQGHPHPHDESFCGMFCSIDDQSAGFWAGWPDQQTFH